MNSLNNNPVYLDGAATMPVDPEVIKVMISCLKDKKVFGNPSAMNPSGRNAMNKIDKARKEAERKEIEANGIAKFQQIVNRTITPQLQRWKGVEATQEISKSPNSKVIVIGNGDGDLPIILGGQ